MANSRHLAILRQGVKTWNEWRDKHLTRMIWWLGSPSGDPEFEEQFSIQADLSGADLRGIKELRGADFRGVNLHGANLSGAEDKKRLRAGTMESQQERRSLANEL